MTRERSVLRLLSLVRSLSQLSLVSLVRDDGEVVRQEPSEPRYLKIFTVLEVIAASGSGYTRS
jgi:hypothetical protein